MEISLIIAAAGASTRMGGGSKTLLSLLGQPVLSYSLTLFAADDAVGEIVVAAAAPDMAAISHICLAYPKARVVAGGSDRSASVMAALSACSAGSTHIAVHDGARPLLHAADWAALKAAVPAAGGAVLATPPVDSIKLLGAGQQVEASLERSRLACVQTPQLFTAAALRQAYAAARAQQIAATDDAALVERLGLPVTVVWSQHENFKLTFPADVRRAELALQARKEGMEL